MNSSVVLSAPLPLLLSAELSAFALNLTFWTFWTFCTFCTLKKLSQNLVSCTWLFWKGSSFMLFHLHWTKLRHNIKWNPIHYLKSIKLWASSVKIRLRNKLFSQTWKHLSVSVLVWPAMWVIQGQLGSWSYFQTSFSCFFWNCPMANTNTTKHYHCNHTSSRAVHSAHRPPTVWWMMQPYSGIHKG